MTYLVINRYGKLQKCDYIAVRSEPHNQSRVELCAYYLTYVNDFAEKAVDVLHARTEPFEGGEEQCSEFELASNPAIFVPIFSTMIF